MVMNNKVFMWILVLFPIVALSGFFGTLYLKNRLPTEILNQEKTPLEFKDNSVQCPQCHMYLMGKKHSAQIITRDLKTHFFDDIGCAVLWLEEQKIELETVVFWIMSNDTNRYTDALKAFYSVNDTTPMHYGFGAYEQPKDGLIDFHEMRTRMLRGETMNDPKIRQHLQQGH